jgi:hypothetical protein
MVDRILDTLMQSTLLKRGDAFDADVLGNEQLRFV